MRRLGKIPDDFDWKMYLKLNPDVGKVKSYSTMEGAKRHWFEFGEKEGRKYIIEKQKEEIINDAKKSSEQLDCIITRESIYNPFTSVRQFILSKFSNDQKYNNTLVLLGYNVGPDISKYRKQYPDKKIVIYQLEQIFDNKSNWYNSNEKNDRQLINRTNHIKKQLKECDEIWDYDVKNIDFLIKEGFNNIKHVPLGYTQELVRKNTITNPKYDLLFYGEINERRAKILSILCKKYAMCIIVADKNYETYINYDFGKYMVTSKFGDKLFRYIFNSKIIINIHYYESFLQEQVRIFDLLINNKIVISEKSLKNHFGNLIYEFNDENEMIEKIDYVLKNDIWKNPNVSENFKNNNFKNFKVGAIYNTFYGLEMIERSINSIRNCVDYIVVVHQKTGLKNNPEPNINKYILEYLVNNKIVNDIVYYQNDSQEIQSKILQKRNIGLEYCKNNGCDFVMPMDTDELYDSIELMKELNYMHDNNIDTLYSPIRSYYYDEYHYFDDTYYVPSVYRVNDRKFVKVSSSVLIDPVRKMIEGKYKISTMPMHHYTYLNETYFYKINNSVMCINNTLRQNIIKIYNHLLSWSEGQDGLVHTNNKETGNLTLTLVKLKKKITING